MIKRQKSKHTLLSRYQSKLLRLFILVISITLCACIRVPKSDHSKFEPEQNFQPQIRWTSQPVPPFDKITVPKTPCDDKDKSVIATCVKFTNTIVPISDRQVFVGERQTGKIVEFNNKKRIKDIATFPIDNSNSGGLLDYALSPDYTSNSIIYALITTTTDIRLVRVTEGNYVQPILTGIPLDHSAPPSGAIMFIDDRLYILIGAGMYSSHYLQGSLFYLTDLSTFTPEKPHVLYSGFQGRVDMCPDMEAKTMYIVNHQSFKDTLLSAPLIGKHTITTLWTWFQPVGVASCITTDKNSIIISENESQGLLSLNFGAEGLITSQPKTILNNKYGRINRLSADRTGALYLGTVNYGAPHKRSNDDRVIKIKLGSSSSGINRA